MINWKVVVGSGAGAAVLSLLTGIISGVSVGTLVLRALMWGVIFCGVGTGISFLISKYLPELLSLSSSEAKAENRPNVDIVLPDENPHTDRESDAWEYPEATDFEGAEPVEEVTNEPDLAEPSSAAGNNLVEEVEEIGGPGGEPTTRNTGLTGENADEAGGLPDFEGDEDDFSAGPAHGTRRAADISDITSMSSRSGKVDVLGLQADSEDIAQAIRTALKKDQKG